MFNEIHDIMMTFLWFDLCSVAPLTCADLSYTYRSHQQPWALNAYENYQGAIAIVTGILLHTYIYTYIHTASTTSTQLHYHMRLLHTHMNNPLVGIVIITEYTTNEYT